MPRLYHRALGVLLGNGDGTFQVAVTYDSGGYNAQSVAIADVNGDGKPDLLVANEASTTVGVLLGNGDGTFQVASTYGSGGRGAQSVAVSDVNGDGNPDLLMADASGEVGVLLGNGDGTFRGPVTYNSGGFVAQWVAVADVNSDGKPDLLVANCSPSGSTNCGNEGVVGVLLGNGDGTFQAAVSYGSGGTDAFAVAEADVNGDGKLDLLVTNVFSDSVGVLLGNGDGTFQMAVTYSVGGAYAFSVAFGDLNGDGKVDLLVATCGMSIAWGGNGSVAVLLGNGDGTFQTAVSYDTGGYDAVSAAAVDVNGDGKPDVLVANEWDSIDGTHGSLGVLLNASLGPTVTALASSLNPSNFGQAVTFTATVTSQGFGGTPTGTVTFFDGTKNIGNSSLDNSGVATVTISTLAVGKHSITATYNGDANFSSSTSHVLYQVVQGAIVVLSPTSLNFGNQTVGIPSSPRYVKMQNTGNIDLIITSIQITGTNNPDFDQANNCPSSLPPHKSCNIRVTFTPTTTGTRNAAVSITDNAPDSPQSVQVTGVGVLPAVSFLPTSLTFPTQLVFTTSPAQKLTLTNTGLGILKITAAKFSGPFSGTTNCGKTLAPGASCTANVVFKPTTKGPLSGSITVTDNAPYSPQSVPLTGTGTYVQLNPKNLNFGTQPVGTTSPPKYITLSNKGGEAVNITDLSIKGPNAGDFAQQNNCGNSVPRGGYCKIRVTFTPTAQGKRTAAVSVSDDGGGSPQLAPLVGTGTP